MSNTNNTRKSSNTNGNNVDINNRPHKTTKDGSNRPKAYVDRPLTVDTKGMNAKQKLLLWRREQIFSMRVAGESETSIANKLKIDQSTVSVDVQWLRKRAAMELKNYMTEKLPLLISEAMESYSGLIRDARMLYAQPDTDTHTKMGLISLIQDLTEIKLQTANGAIFVEEAIA